jgi:WD40 repeat protein
MQVFAGHTDSITALAFTPDGPASPCFFLYSPSPSADTDFSFLSSFLLLLLPPGKRLLTASVDSSLILWDPRSPSPLQTFKPTDDRFYLPSGITSLAIHPNSNLAVVGGAEGGVRVVNLLKGDVTAAFQGHAEGDSVESVVFLVVAGNGVVVTAGTDGKACAWDVTTLRLRAELKHEVRLLLSCPLRLGLAAFFGRLLDSTPQESVGLTVPLCCLASLACPSTSYSKPSPLSSSTLPLSPISSPPPLLTLRSRPGMSVTVLSSVITRDTEASSTLSTSAAEEKARLPSLVQETTERVSFGSYRYVFLPPDSGSSALGRRRRTLLLDDTFDRIFFLVGRQSRP